MIMELHGAKDYFGCNKAILVTNGEIMPDAIEVANRLQIDLQIIDYPDKTTKTAEGTLYSSASPKKVQDIESKSSNIFLPMRNTRSIPFGKHTLCHSKGKLCIITEEKKI